MIKSEPKRSTESLQIGCGQQRVYCGSWQRVGVNGVRREQAGLTAVLTGGRQPPRPSWGTKIKRINTNAEDTRGKAIYHCSRETV